MALEPLGRRITETTPLVLGSASPRRLELLMSAGLPVVVSAPTVDETSLPGEPPSAYLDRVTQSKLDAVRSHLPADTVLAVIVADTIVVSAKGRILGKPEDDVAARETLEELEGSTHEVRTRFVLARALPGTPVAHAETVTTRVTFRAFERGEALAYARTGEGRDKAGGYAAQGRAAAFITKIDGSYTGVVGLPVCEVVVALRRLGWW